MRAVTLIAALVAAGGVVAQGETPKPAGSPPARPPVDIPPPPCSSAPDLVKLDGLLIQWNQAYQPLQAGISLEVAASNSEGLAQADEARAKDAVSSLRAGVLDLQTEVGVRERQIRTVEDSLKPSGAASDRLSDKDYLADRQKLLAALQTMLAKAKEQYAKAQVDLTKAESGLQAAEDHLKTADQGFGDAARGSFQAMQADKSAEDAFESELLTQRSKTCAQSQVAAAAPATPAPSPPPQVVAQERPPAAPAPTPPPAAPASDTVSPPAAEPAPPPPAESQQTAPQEPAQTPAATQPTPPPEPTPPEAAPAVVAQTDATAPAPAPESAPVACTASKVETDVLATLNRARTSPAQFYNVLEQDFGRGSYRDARIFLKGLKPVTPLACDGRLEAAAHKHLADQGPLGGESHTGSDGSQPWQRIQAAGVTAQVYAEEISVTFPTALGVVSALIIDPQTLPVDPGPNPPTLVHPTRLDVMNPDLAAAGVACGPNKKFKVMCVIDFSSRPHTSGS